MTGLDVPESVVTRVRGWRHDLHRIPETAFCEHETSAYVARVLRELGYDVTAGIGGTGLVGSLTRGTSSRTTGLRSELDALPITEQSGVDYASHNPDTMHACGHDGHMAKLGAAALLAEEGGSTARSAPYSSPRRRPAVGPRRWSTTACSSDSPSTGSSGSTTSPAHPPGTCARAPGL